MSCAGDLAKIKRALRKQYPQFSEQLIEDIAAAIKFGKK